MSRRITASAPSRLHFGLTSFSASESTRAFGGVGMMVASPRIEVTIRESSGLEITGSYVDRAADVCERFANNCGIDQLGCSITIESQAPLHAGFGLGTQVAVAVARGLAACKRESVQGAEHLARLTGRCKRSSVGTYGSLLGGLIVDGGKQQSDVVGELTSREQVPDEWRVLLVQAAGQGESGEREQQAFESLPEIEPRTTARLTDIANVEIAPACRAREFSRFTKSVERFGRLAGECFAPWQGGVFASAEIAKAVEQLAAAGASGVGQSSWGPTVYGFAESAEEAESIATEFLSATGIELQVTRADNTGLVIHDSEAGPSG